MRKKLKQSIQLNKYIVRQSVYIFFLLGLLLQISCNNKKTINLDCYNIEFVDSLSEFTLSVVNGSKYKSSIQIKYNETDSDTNGHKLKYSKVKEELLFAENDLEIEFQKSYSIIDTSKDHGIPDGHGSIPGLF